jgi:hypothetical protein
VEWCARPCFVLRPAMLDSMQTVHPGECRFAPGKIGILPWDVRLTLVF